MPGVAWQQNNSFLPPEGKTFSDIVEPPKGEKEFGTDDLLAAFYLQKAAYPFRFAHRAMQDSRRVTRFLFYFVVIHLIREIIGQNCLRWDVTQAVLTLAKPENEKPLQQLLDAAIQVIDDYLDASKDDSVYKETTFTGNLNTFLKSQQLGRGLSYTPNLAQHLLLAIKVLGRAVQGQSTKPIDEIKMALKT